MMKHVPNTLSGLRCILSISLLFLAKSPLVFTAVYVIAGITDYLDGKIARKYNVESALGAKLEAIGDSLLFGGAFASILFFADIDFGTGWELLIKIIPLVIAILYKLVNVAVTHKRFDQWNMMHTRLNKSVFGSLFFVAPVIMFMGEFNFWIVIIVSAAMILACLEETITLFKIEEYDVNCEGIWTETITKKIRKAS